jgi:hypothetical protein
MLCYDMVWYGMVRYGMLRYATCAVSAPDKKSTTKSATEPAGAVSVRPSPPYLQRTNGPGRIEVHARRIEVVGGMRPGHARRFDRVVGGMG